MENIEKEDSPKSIWEVITIFVIIGISLTIIIVFWKFEISEGSAAIGDLIGGILGPILSFASIYILFHELKIQRHELALQRQELANTNDIHRQNLQHSFESNVEDIRFKELEFYSAKIGLFFQSIDRFALGDVTGMTGILFWGRTSISKGIFESKVSPIYYQIASSLESLIAEGLNDLKPQFRELKGNQVIVNGDNLGRKYKMLQESVLPLLIKNIALINGKIESYESFQGISFPLTGKVSAYLDHQPTLPKDPSVSLIKALLEIEEL